MLTQSNDFDALFKAIPHKLEEHLAKVGTKGSHREWTNAVRAALNELARAGNLDCRHTAEQDANTKNKEYLCDVLWLKTDGGANNESSPLTEAYERRIRRCVLACESEWGLDRLSALVYDFSKLLVIRSDYILFIAEARNDADRDNIVKEFRAAWAALDHKIPADRIMVLIHKYERENPTTLLEICPLVGP